MQVIAEEHDRLVRRIARWLRNIDRLDEIEGAKVGWPEFNPLWNASFALEREFGSAARTPTEERT